jgi:hypothetical protein
MEFVSYPARGYRVSTSKAMEEGEQTRIKPLKHSGYYMHQDAINSDHRVYLSVSYDYQAKLPLFR